MTTTTAAPTGAMTRFPPAQLRVIALAALGHRDLEIAEITRLKVGTVGDRLSAAMAASGAQSRSGLVVLACRWGQLQGIPVQRAQPVALSAKSAEALEGIAGDLPTKQIARRLGRSEAAIKDRCTVLYRQLGARNRAHAVLIAWQLRVLPEVTT